MKQDFAIELLKELGAHIYTEKNLDALLTLDHSHTNVVAFGLTILKDAGMLNQNKLNTYQVNFDAVVAAGEYAEHLAHGIDVLNGADILTQENRDALVDARENASYAAEGFRSLNRQGMLDQLNRDAIVASGAQAVTMAYNLWTLKVAKILTVANRESLVNLLHVGEREDLTADRLTFLSSRNILTQRNFNAIMASHRERAETAYEEIISKHDEHVSMLILSGFITVLGIAAVAIALTVLSASTLGVPLAILGAVVVCIGIRKILKEAGFFAPKTTGYTEVATDGSMLGSPKTK